MNNVSFCKMHSLGNDFLVIEMLSQSVSLDRNDIMALADRHTGVGFDQLLLVGKSEKADFSCRIFNQDGSEAEQCGNGMRCVARFLHEEKLINHSKVSIETLSGIVEAILPNYEEIEVRMGKPLIKPMQEVTLANTGRELKKVSLMIISMGNPHAILRVKSLDEFPIGEIGSKIATHADFPEGINVGFMELGDSHHIRLRTFERGVGETLACGTNACAAAVAGIINEGLLSPVEIELKLGKLKVEWEGINTDVKMRGPATRVYCGKLNGIKTY